MIATPPALTAAFRSPGQRPSIRVTMARDIPSYTLLASGSMAGGAFHHAVVVAPDGSIVRAWMQNTPSPLAGQVWVQRVTSPTVPTQWTTWSPLGATVMLSVAGVSLAVIAMQVWLIAVDSATGGIQLASSSDNGQTWSAFTTVIPVGATETPRAVAIAGGNVTAGDSVAIFTLIDDGSLTSTAVRAKVSINAGAGWSSLTTSIFPAAPSGAGITAVKRQGAFQVVASLYGASRTGGGLALVASRFDGASWSSPVAVQPNDDAGVGVAVQWPSLTIVNDSYRLTYTERDTGAYSGLVYGRTVLVQSSDGEHWDDGMTFVPPLMLIPPVPCIYERICFEAAGTTYVVDNERVFSAPPPRPSLDLTPAVLAYDLESGVGRPARLRITLDSNTHLWTTDPVWGFNSRFVLEEGYVDPAGVPSTLVTGSHFLVRRWSIQRAMTPGGPRCDVVVEAVDIACKLYRESRHEWNWTNQSVAWVATEIVTKAGIASMTVPSTPRSAEIVPRFRIGTGTTWLAALERLLRIYGCQHRASSSGGYVVVEAMATDPSVISLGTADLFGSTWNSEGEHENHVRCVGAMASGAAAVPMGESWDYEHVVSTGEVRYHYVAEPQISTGTQAQLRSDLDLAMWQRSAVRHSMTTPRHPGLELFDVISVADPQVGISGSFRIAGMRGLFDAASATYESTYQLEGV